MKTFTKQDQENLSPADALKILQEGNERFCGKNMCSRDLMRQAEETSAGQFPFGVVLSCIDSRVSSELIFDQGIGDIFSVRVAGNVVNEDVLGSMEFGCKVAGSKVIVVLGHTACGAVKGACDHVELGNLTHLLKKISPAVDAEKSGVENASSSNADFVHKVTIKNIHNAIDSIKSKSEILKEMDDKGEIKIVGAIHDIGTGKVSFLS